MDLDLFMEMLQEVLEQSQIILVDAEEIGTIDLSNVEVEFSYLYDRMEELKIESEEVGEDERT